MSAYGLGDDLFVGESPEAVRARVDEAVGDGVDVVVAAGGDGTVGLVADRLDRDVGGAGYPAAGSAMNVGRSLGIPRDLDAAAALIAHGVVTTIDIGRASDGTFLEMASVGLNAAVLGEAHRFAEGSFDSIIGLVRAVIRYHSAPMTIDLDHGTVHTGALMVVVANTPFTGAGLTLAPAARLDDGLFDVAIFRHFSKVELLRHLVAIVAGHRRYSPKVETYRSAKVRVGARSRLPARADDRDLGTTPIEVTVVPSAFRVVVAPPEDRVSAAEARPALTP